MFSCKSTCAPANPATDSVRVDVSALAEIEQGEVERFDMGGGRFVELHGKDRLTVGAKDAKEADEVVALWQQELDRRKKETELRAKEQAEAAARERAAQLERERAEEEQRRQEEEENQRLEQERIEEERRRKEEEERQEAERRRQQEERLKRMEEERRREAERLAREQEERVRKEAVDLFCKQHGFEGVNAPRRSGCSVFGAATTYPLHVAAELADAVMVELLLKEGANPIQKNSAGKTPGQAAQKKNKGGSHAAVQSLLVGGARPTAGGA